MVMTASIFSILASVLLFNAGPGRTAFLHETGLVVLAPVLWTIEEIGRLRLWLFSENADLASALLIGFLTFLLSLSYAAVAASILNLERKRAKHIFSLKRRGLASGDLHGSVKVGVGLTGVLLLST